MGDEILGRDPTQPPLPDPPMSPPTGVPEAMAGMIHESEKKVAVLGNELASRQTLPSDYDAVLRDGIKQGAGHKKAEAVSMSRTYIMAHPNLKVSDVPGGAVARKMDKEQHEQVKLQGIGIDLRKKTSSYAERKKTRQSKGG